MDDKIQIFEMIKEKFEDWNGPKSKIFGKTWRNGQLS